jgi:bifunctional DNase/RNase
MIAVKVAKVLPLEKHGCVIVVLVDEQRQRALPLWYSTLQVSMAQRLTGGIAEPLTTDFVRHILEALGGTVDEIAIDTLQDDILYARVQLHGPDRLQTTRTIKARLDDALPLAVQLQCPLVVADHLLEQRGIMLAGKGETFEQQIEAVAQLAKNMPLPFGREAKPVVFAAIPRNLDFREGLQSWSVTGFPADTERAEMQLDPVHQYDGRPSLQIVLRGVEPSPDRVLPQAMAMLKHEGFLADSYRGQRLRTVIYAKSEAVKQAIFHLTVTQPASEQSDVPTVRHMTNSRQHPIEGTSDWTRYELVIDAPPDAATIEFSCHLVGSGTLWLAGLRFETVEKGLPLTGTDIMPPPQKPLNLDFAQGLAYWTLNGRFVQDYAALVDDKTRFQGQVSATLKAIAKDPRGVGSLYQTLNAFNYHGKRVRVNGMIKTQDVEQGAGLYLGSSTANGERSEHLIQGTNDWTPFEVELDIPESEFFIRFGIMLRGKGQIWLAAVHLDSMAVPESAG